MGVTATTKYMLYCLCDDGPARVEITHEPGGWFVTLRPVGGDNLWKNLEFTFRGTTMRRAIERAYQALYSGTAMGECE